MTRTTSTARRAVRGAGAALAGALCLSVATAASAAGAPTRTAEGQATPEPLSTSERVDGIDLTGTESVSEKAPMLEPGVYSDRLTASEEGWRAYRVTRTAPGSTLHVSLTTQPTTYTDGSGQDAYEDLRIRLLAPDGTECYGDEVSAGDVGGISSFVTISATVAGAYPKEDESAPEEACRATGTFSVLVGRDGPQKSTPAELQVLEEPPVTTLDDLPEPGENHPSEVELPAREATPVRGARRFTDAPEITSGTWSDTLVPGETRVYRVKVDYGQTARFTANGPTGGFRFPADHELEDLWVEGLAYAPDRQLVDDSSTTGSFSSGSSSPQSVNTAPLRFRNRFADIGPSTSGMSGWYYYAVTVGEEDLGETLADQPLKIAFTVDVEGKASDAVRYDHTAGDWGDPAEADEGMPGWLPWAGGGLLALAVLSGIAGFLLRRRLAGPRA